MLLNNRILVNGRAYDWGTINILINGASAISISNISFGESMNIQNLFGTSLYGSSIGYGHIVPKASITLNADELFVLGDIAINGVLQNLPLFDIYVTFMLDENIRQLGDGDKASEKLPRTIILKNCKIKNNGMEVGQGDMNIETKLDLFISHIVWKPITQADMINNVGKVVTFIKSKVQK